MVRWRVNATEEIAALPRDVARMLAVGDALHRSEVDIQSFLFEKSFVIGDPHGCEIHGQRRAEYNDLFF